MSRFKKGDKVKIADNTNLRSFAKGEEVTIKIIDPLLEIILKYYVENASGIGCWVSECEIK